MHTLFTPFHLSYTVTIPYSLLDNLSMTVGNITLSENFATATVTVMVEVRMYYLMNKCIHVTINYEAVKVDV